MKKRVIIIPATILAIATPGAVIAAKHLDKSSTVPIIKSSATEWSKTAQVTVATAATFGGSDLDYYEYCINDTDNVETCDWKISSVETIRVRNLGTSYVWVRGISKYGVVSGISDYVLTRVDRNKPTASSENEATTSSITVTVTATDDSGIKSYEYSIDDSEYVEDGTTHTFSNLASGTTYNIKIRITDLAGNMKILNFTQSTSSPVVTRTGRSFSGINFVNMPSGSPSGDSPSGGFPGHGSKPDKRPTDGGSEDIPENPDIPDLPDTPENPDQPEQPEEPEQPQEPEQPERPDCPEQPEKPEKTEKTEKPEGVEGEDEPEEPEEPEQPEQPNLPLCPEKPDEPEQPEQPENPGQPNQPGDSENQENPENPDQPSNPEQQDEATQPQEPEINDSASGSDQPIINEPENNGSSDAIENSEPTPENNTILEDSNPSENTSAIAI